jgi:hypothetical protein
MSLDDVATLLAEGIARELRMPVPVTCSSPLWTFKPSSSCWLALGVGELERVRADIDAAAPPMRPQRGGAALLVAALFSGAMDDVLAARAAVISAAVRPHAKRYAEQMRMAMESKEPAR